MGAWATSFSLSVVRIATGIQYDIVLRGGLEQNTANMVTEDSILATLQDRGLVMQSQAGEMGRFEHQFGQAVITIFQERGWTGGAALPTGFVSALVPGCGNPTSYQYQKWSKHLGLFSRPLP